MLKAGLLEIVAKANLNGGKFSCYTSHPQQVEVI